MCVGYAVYAGITAAQAAATVEMVAVVGVGGAVIVHEARSKPNGPLPEADGRPHSIPKGDGGYITHDDDGGKQYRPTGKPHGEIERPNVKEWEKYTRPDGTTGNRPKPVGPYKDGVRKPNPGEARPVPKPKPPPPKPKPAG